MSGICKGTVWETEMEKSPVLTVWAIKKIQNLWGISTFVILHTFTDDLVQFGFFFFSLKFLHFRPL